MPSLTLKAVGADWTQVYPNANGSGSSVWRSLNWEGGSTNEKNNSFMGFGFQWGEDKTILETKKIDAMVLRLGNLSLHVEDPRPDYPNTDDRIYEISGMNEYAYNRFSAITYNRMSSYGAMSSIGGKFTDGGYLTDAQIKYFKDCWMSGHTVGTSNFRGEYSTVTWTQQILIHPGYPNPDYYQTVTLSGPRKKYHAVSSKNQAPTLTIYYSDLSPEIAPSYPVDVNVKAGNQTTISWAFSGGDTTSGAKIIQKSYTLRIIDPDGIETVYTEETAQQYKEFPPNSFKVGKYYWSVQAVADTGIESNIGTAEFSVIGGTDAPDITNITNTSMPIIEWTAGFQDAVELRISQGGTVLWESGMLPGSDRTSYEVPKMFDDGEYAFELRVLNTYGYYTEWDSKVFTLSPEKPNPPTNIFASIRDKYAVSVEGTPSTSKTYVVRRQSNSDEIEIIGRYIEGRVFDYKIPLNVNYEYTLRAYDGGYCDGEWYAAQIKADGIVIHDGRNLANYVHIDSNTEDFFVKKADSVDKTLINCLGRPYPIKEPGEWIKSTRSATGYVSKTDYKKLVDITLHAPKVYAKIDGEILACDIDTSLDADYVDGGKIVTVSLTRIEDDIEVEL